ncbi:hypothetical protein V8G54_005315, partial [Vigna mungo]
EIALENKHNRRKQTLAHTGRSKSIARKREEMEKECGHKVRRGEVWIASVRRPMELFSVMRQGKLVQEHCERVRGLGLGPCPSKVFGVHACSHSGSSSSIPFNVELQSQVSSLTSSSVQLQSG